MNLGCSSIKKRKKNLQEVVAEGSENQEYVVFLNILDEPTRLV